MDRVTQKIGELKEQLESAAFLVTQPNEHQAAHREILNALALLTELDVAYSGGNSIKPSKPKSKSISDEINKVARKLKLWAKRPHQMNSRILTAYLRLERKGINPITESNLNDAIGNEPSFYSNFVQMRNIAANNHGKVFDQDGESVTLWSPVLSAVREYERTVLDDD